MTVSANDTVERYEINGAGPYAFSFRIFNDTDLTVVALSTATPPVVVPLTYLTHYTVTGANESDGGSITLTTAAYTPYDGYTVDIRSNTPEDQPTSIRNQPRFLPEIHEDAFDYLSRQIQDVNRRLDRTVRFPDDTLNTGEMTPIQSWLSTYLSIGATGELEAAALTSSGAITHSVIAALLYPSEVGETGVINTLYKRGHVLRYGANDTPGTTDMTTAFQNAALSSLNPYAPADTYLITGAIPLRDNQHWVLDGARISITGNTQVFTVAAGIDDWSITGDWSVTGDNGAAGATSGTGAAVKIIDSMRWRVEGLTAKNIRGWGVLVQPGSSAASRAEKGQVIGLQAFACYVGAECQVGGGAEYVQFVAPVISRCAQAWRVAAGNISVVGGSSTDNTEGVDLVAGTNHAHGKFVGHDINHTTNYAVKATDVTNGHFFIGCNIYEGDIWLKDSQGVMFKDCTVDVDNYYFDGSQGCGFVNCTLPDAYTNTIQNSFDSSPSYTIWDNCKKLTGKNDGTLANVKGVLVGCTSAGITITAATLAAETTLLLTDASNYSANDNAQTLFDGYAAGTGIFTCHGLGDGKVRVSALLNVTCNAADDAAMATVYAFLRKNNTGAFQYFARTRVSTTSYKFTIDAVVDMQDTDNLRIRLGSTSTLANDITVASSETAVIVEGL